MKKLLIVLVAQVLLFNANASITTATGSGDWDESGNWDNGNPGCFDTIVIPFGFTIEITTTEDLTGCTNDSIIVIIEGTLAFQNGRKLKLPCDSDVYVEAGGSIQTGGGGGNSNYIEICDDIYWNAGDGPVTGPATFCDGGCPTTTSPLPIELAYFTAQSNGKRQIDLSWQTASETNNRFFTVERSKDGIQWEVVLYKDAVGNSSVRNDYNDFDVNPLFGDSYYRLKQTDYDGAYSYSPSVKVSSNDLSEISIYPNPVGDNGRVMIAFPEQMKNDVTIYIVGLDGKLEHQELFVIKDSHQAIINLPSGLESGVYSIRSEYFSEKLFVK